ncbi:MAG: hypothetical protein ABEJ24_00815 [Candidatus Magasanikbacteria bacterium]
MPVAAQEILVILMKFFLRPVPIVAFDLFIIGGWLIVCNGLFEVIDYLWVKEYKEPKAKSDFNWKLLAIDVPEDNIQTPKAVEQMFCHLAGAYVPANIAMVYRRGFKQRKFSCEIVSIEGYIQFLIRTEEDLLDLTEAAIYAQYPDARITEVEDYVDNVPSNYPNETHDVWAAEFSLAESNVQPIRTYEEFEHHVSEEEEFKDPMNSFLESFSRMGDGEQLWFQIVIKPVSDSWKKEGIEKVKDLIDAEDTASGTSISDVMGQFKDEALGGGGSSQSNDDGPPNKMLYLTPGEQNLVESIEDKITKIGFFCMIRGVYVARKEVFKPQRGAHSLIGAVNQFNDPSKNSLKVSWSSDTSFLFAERRSNYIKNSILRNYMGRSRKRGAPFSILNVEELATLWHFPMQDVKTPMVQKSKEKQSEPPSGLPTESMSAGATPESIVPTAEEDTEDSEQETSPPKEGSEETEEGRPFG